jgi:hypothetical protein
MKMGANEQLAMLAMIEPGCYRRDGDVDDHRAAESPVRAWGVLPRFALEGGDDFVRVWIDTRPAGRLSSPTKVDERKDEARRHLRISCGEADR